MLNLRSRKTSLEAFEPAPIPNHVIEELTRASVNYVGKKVNEIKVEYSFMKYDSRRFLKIISQMSANLTALQRPVI